MEIKRVLDLDPFSLMDTRVTHTLLPTEWLCRYLIPSPCRWCGLDAHVQKECFLTQKDRASWNGSFSLFFLLPGCEDLTRNSHPWPQLKQGREEAPWNPCAVGEFWRHWFPEMRHSTSMEAWPRSRASTEVCLFSRNLGQGSHGLLFFFWDKISPWTWSLSVQQY